MNPWRDEPLFFRKKDNNTQGKKSQSPLVKTPAVKTGVGFFQPMGATFAPALCQTSTFAVGARTPKGKDDLGLLIPKEVISAAKVGRAHYFFFCVNNISVVCTEST